MPKRVELTPAARGDLDDLWDYSSAVWGVGQTERYLRGVWAAITRFAGRPDSAPERRDFRPPVRLGRYRSHLIVFRVEDDRLIVLRIAHIRRNWSALLAEDGGAHDA